MSEAAEGRLLKILGSSIGQIPGRYLHWDELRHRKPPDGFTHEEWWIACKWARGQRRNLSFACTPPFGFTLPPFLLEALHRIDTQATDGPVDRIPVLNREQRDRYLISSLIEESIRSSQLEGASTTHRVAKDLLRSGRPPRDRSERMILNNYLAMRHVRELRDQPLTVGMLKTVQEIVTKETLTVADGAGRLRRDSDEVMVVAYDNTVLHRPPPASELESLLEQLCAFANGERDHDEFLHPVLLGILLHFMLAWIHPFVDGNGRTARALFYWAMSRANYPLLEFTSISKIIHDGPAKYARAFLYTETDDNDLTYFVDYHLQVILRAVEELVAYLQRKTDEVNDIERMLRSSDLSVHLNHRQVALLSHAMRKPNHLYSYQSHSSSHRVTYLTGRKDLLQLAELGLLRKLKRGRTTYFRAVSNLGDAIEGLAES